MTRAEVGAATVTVDRADVQVTNSGVPDDAVFELGSLSKTVTAALVCLAARDGTLALDDGVGRWLDAGGNGSFTVRALATHTSGLPRVAARPVGAGVRDPYRDLDADRAEHELRTASPADGYCYSNLGYQLLGLVLERATGSPFVDLVDDWLPRRFGVAGVGIEVDGTPLTGHVDGVEVPAWRQPLPAAGGLRCTAAGLGARLRAHLTPADRPDRRAADALADELRPAVPIDPARRGACSWVCDADGVTHHAGQTAGFAAAAAVHTARSRAAGRLCADSARGAALPAEVRALLDASPRPDVAPQPPEPHWATRARDVVAALCDDRPDDVCAMMTPQLRTRVTREALAATWLLQSAATGPMRDLDVTCTARGRYTAADAVVRGAHGSGRVAMIFTPDAQIARFALLRNDQPTPW